MKIKTKDFTSGLLTVNGKKFSKRHITLSYIKLR